LLNAARASAGKYQFCETAYIFFGLIAVTGMRTSEALALDDESVDLSSGIIEIRNTKFKKSRKLPLHASTTIMLKRYVKNRDKHYPIRKTLAFFINCRGDRLGATSVQKSFRKMCITGDVFTKGSLDPRIIDLRHTFAVTNLLRCYQEDLDVDQTVAFLSTYLGHENPENTYWYLTSTPELLNLINQRTEKKYWRK
jgi:integrase